MSDNSFLDIFYKICSIMTPVIVTVLTVIGWRLRNSIERKIVLEQRLREDRVKIYNDLVTPFIYIFSNENVKSDKKNLKGKLLSAEGLRIILTAEYRETCFKMLLFGSDGVVRACNRMQQHVFSSGENGDINQDNTNRWLALLGDLFLEIRKSMGNDDTNLEWVDMLESFVTDLRNNID